MATTHISTAEEPAPRAKAGISGVYRGIRLVKPAVPPRTPLASLREAVKAAVAKNADAIGRIK